MMVEGVMEEALQASRQEAEIAKMKKSLREELEPVPWSGEYTKENLDVWIQRVRGSPFVKEHRLAELRELRDPFLGIEDTLTEDFMKLYDIKDKNPRVIPTSGDQNNCLIFAFLLSASESFKSLTYFEKIVTAHMFRQFVLKPRVTEPTLLRDVEGPEELPTDVLDILASMFGVGFLVFGPTIQKFPSQYVDTVFEDDKVVYGIYYKDNHYSALTFEPGYGRDANEIYQRSSNTIVATAAVLAAVALDSQVSVSKPEKPDISLLRELLMTFPTSLPKVEPVVKKATGKKSDILYCYIFWNSNVLILKNNGITFPSTTILEDTDAQQYIIDYITETYIYEKKVTDTIKRLKSEIDTTYFYVSYSGKNAYTKEEYPLYIQGGAKTKIVGARRSERLKAKKEPAPAPTPAPTPAPAPAPVEPVPAPVEPVPAPVEPVPTSVEPAPASVEPAPIPAPVDPESYTRIAISAVLAAKALESAEIEKETDTSVEAEKEAETSAEAEKEDDTSVEAEKEAPKEVTSGSVFWLPLTQLAAVSSQIDNINPLLDAIQHLNLDIGVSPDTLRTLPTWVSTLDSSGGMPKALRTDILIGTEYGKQHPVAMSEELKEYQQRATELKSLSGDELKQKTAKLKNDYSSKIIHVTGPDGVKPLPILNPYVAVGYRTDKATTFDSPSESRYDPDGTMKSMNMDVINNLMPTSLTIDKPFTVSILESLWFCGQNPILKNDPRCFPTRLLGELREYQEYKESPKVTMIKNWPLMKYFVMKLKHMIPGNPIPPFDLPLVTEVPSEVVAEVPVEESVSIKPVNPAESPVSIIPVAPTKPTGLQVIPVTEPIQPSIPPIFPPKTRIDSMKTGVLVPLRIGAIGLKPILPSRQLGVLPGIV